MLTPAQQAFWAENGYLIVPGIITEAELEAYRRIYDQFLDNTIDTGANRSDLGAGLGKFTKQASALQIMGVVGGALTPLLSGAVSDAGNPQWVYAILLPCYLFILFYASRGYRSGV